MVKVVPLRMEVGLQGKWADGEGPCVSEMEDVQKEISVTRAMGDIQEGFIKLIKYVRCEKREMVKLTYMQGVRCTRSVPSGASQALGCVQS